MGTRVVSDLLKDINRAIITIAPEASVQEALELMVSEGISSLPVTQGTELVGIISERDYIRKAVPRRIVPWEILVRDIMTVDVICVTRERSVQECIELMSGNRIRHLPVVENRTLIGILSITDVVRALRPAHIEFPGPA